MNRLNVLYKEPGLNAWLEKAARQSMSVRRDLHGIQPISNPDPHMGMRAREALSKLFSRELLTCCELLDYL
jgi:hypothetical protein